MKTFKELLIKLNACDAAIEWAGDKTWQEVYASCHRGDWLLWLFKRTNGDKRLLTRAKGHCANTVRHLMTDIRSINAVDAALAYGDGRISDDKLAAAAAAAYAAAAADADAAAAAYAAAAAAYAYAAAYAAAAAAADADADADANRKRTADICREYLPIESFNISTP